MCHEASCEVRDPPCCSEFAELDRRTLSSTPRPFRSSFARPPETSLSLYREAATIVRWPDRSPIFCRGRQFLLCLLQSGILQDESSKKSNNQQHKPKGEFTWHRPFPRTPSTSATSRMRASDLRWFWAT